MKILAIETALPPGSVCAYQHAGAKSQVILDATRATTAAFAPAMREVLQASGWPDEPVDLVTTCSGPGSFTGIRIGVTAAKSFAYATGCDLLAVNTLELVASQTDVDGEIVAVIDAQRRQLFSATFLRKSGAGSTVVETTRIVDEDEWFSGLKPGQTVSGPGLKRLASRIPSSVRMADQNHWYPKADALAELAYARFATGERHDFWALKPDYFRKSAAEEKADARRASEQG